MNTVKIYHMPVPFRAWELIEQYDDNSSVNDIVHSFEVLADMQGNHMYVNGSNIMIARYEVVHLLITLE